MRATMLGRWLVAVTVALAIGSGWPRVAGAATPTEANSVAHAPDIDQPAPFVAAAPTLALAAGFESADIHRRTGRPHRRERIILHDVGTERSGRRARASAVVFLDDVHVQRLARHGRDATPATAPPHSAS